MRPPILIYALATYAAFLVTFLYAIGFVGGFLVPKGIDDGTLEPTLRAVLIDVGLLGLFGLQHSLMARPWFKARWTRLVAPAIERTSFVLAATLALALLMWQWRPLPEPLWRADGPLAWLLWALFAAGWMVVLGSTWLIDHFDLFGLRQAWAGFSGRASAAPRFVERSLYRHVRHPLMLGFLVAFWATPEMSRGHALFAGVATLYVLVALQIEERDLLRLHGEDYREYRRRVPMLVPWRLGRSAPRETFEMEPGTVRSDSLSLARHRGGAPPARPGASRASRGPPA